MGALRMLTAVIGLAIVAPAPAHAARVAASNDGERTVVVIDGTPGRADADRLAVEVEPPGRTTVTVERGDLDAGAGCHQLAPRVARCTARGEYEVRIRGGTGRDRITLDAARAGDGLLRGGPGRQRLSGGHGVDHLHAGSGRDVLAGDQGADVLDGGPGRDLASYTALRRPVRVRLGPRGSATGGDRLRSIEGAAGGGGADRLVGDDRANVLLGGEGRDTLVGGGGADRLDAGGSLVDVSDGPDAHGDRISCGPGDDVVVDALRQRADTPGPLEVLPRDCERLSAHEWGALAGHTIRAHPRRAGRRVRVPVICNPEERSCRITVTLTAGGRVLGRATKRVRPELRIITVRLRAALPCGSTPVEVRVTQPGYGVRWRVRC